MSRAGFYRKLRNIYSGWYLLFNLAVLLVYYVAVQRLLAIQQFGVVFSAAPAYLVTMGVEDWEREKSRLIEEATHAD